MAKPQTTTSRLICEGCGKTTEWHTHSVSELPDRLMVTLLKKAGWKNDCPACEKLKKTKKGSVGRTL